MRIAIPTRVGCVSSTFDFARMLMVVDMENGRETGRSQVRLPSESVIRRAGRLKDLQVDVLICGAVSRVLAQSVAGFGIQILPYVTGGTDEVLEAYKSGQLAKPRFMLPCAWPGARRRFCSGRRWRHGQANAR